MVSLQLAILNKNRLHIKLIVKMNEFDVLIDGSDFLVHILRMSGCKVVNIVYRYIYTLFLKYHKTCAV